MGPMLEVNDVACRPSQQLSTYGAPDLAGLTLSLDDHGRVSAIRGRVTSDFPECEHKNMLNLTVDPTQSAAGC